MTLSRKLVTLPHNRNQNQQVFTSLETTKYEEISVLGGLIKECL